MKVSKLQLVAAILLISVVANVGLSYRLSCTGSKFAKVDVELLISKLVKTVSEKSLSDEDSKQYSQEYISKLDTLLKKISEQDHLVILPNKAIIAGAIDITDQVEELMRGNDAN
jgi:hypothetical protein